MGGRLGFCSEALDGLASFLGTQPFQTVRTSHLKSDDALRLELSRFVDHSHSAPADHFQDLITGNFGECRGCFRDRALTPPAPSAGKSVDIRLVREENSKLG